MVLAASIVIGCLLLARLSPHETAVAASGEPSMCVALAVIANAALYDRVAPLGASPEMVTAVAGLNAQLAEVRTRLFSLDGIRQLGCRA